MSFFRCAASRLLKGTAIKAIGLCSAIKTVGLCSCFAAVSLGPRLGLVLLFGEEVLSPSLVIVASIFLWKN